MRKSQIRLYLGVIVATCCFALSPFIRGAEPQDSLHPQELRPVKYGKSKQRLGDIPSPPVSLGIPRKAEPIRLNPNVTVHLGPLEPDPLAHVRGLTDAEKAVVKINNTIEGIGAGLALPPGKGADRAPFQIQMAPPDTNGAIGDTQYVQWVNNSLAIFDKKTGRLQFGPVPGNSIWKNFGGNCEENNNGDPIVQYDKLAKRWVLAQFSVNNGKQTGYSECIAVSTTSDATGLYWLYEFQYPSLDDYPKFGVWPDGYYVSFNMYDVYVDEKGKEIYKFLGPRACVYDRESMLIGQPGRQECFQLSTDYFGFIPSDFDGSKTPPAGAPNYYVALGTKPDTLDMWRFRTDWNNPEKSTFGKGKQNAPDSTISVEHYNLACNGTGGTCVPQPPRVKGQEQLDSLGDRLMFRLAYRRLDGHESLLLNHSVDTGGDNSRTAVRWYELRDLDKDNPTVFEQATLAPDAAHRWIGSIAMDKNGNIAMGFNLSSETIHPGVRVTARLAGDPVGQMRNETMVLNGSGIQTCSPPSPGRCQCVLKDGSCDTLTRWGDYSSLTIDPEDDCTFWYTGEYQREDGAFNWHTVITSFQVGEGCRSDGRSKNKSGTLASQRVPTNK